VIAHGLAEFLRNAASQFNSEVGDALSGVKYVRSGECLRWASIKALATTAAQVRRGQLMRPERGLQVKRGQYDAEKKEGPEHLIQQQRVFPDPTKPRVLCEHALVKRASVHVSARFKRFGVAPAKKLDQSVQHFPQYVVIVVAPGVPRDPTAWFLVTHAGRRFRGKRMLGVVVEQAHDHTANSRQNSLQIRAAPVGEVAHFTGIAARQPFREILELRESLRAQHSAQIKSQELRLIYNPHSIGKLFHTKGPCRGSIGPGARLGWSDSRRRCQLKLCRAVRSSV
jgi:hypothetical protein